MGRSITGSSFENKKHCIYSLRLNNMQQQHKRGDKQSNVELNVVLKVLPLPPLLKASYECFQQNPFLINSIVL